MQIFRATQSGMNSNEIGQPLILVIEDVEETRIGIERLLNANQYRVVTVQGEDQAVLQSLLSGPDLILMSLGVDAAQLIAIAQRIRERAHLRRVIPIVIFCVPTIEEGSEVEVAPNLYLTRPDNFDQLRGLLIRLLRMRLPSC
jgi:CheY-like chemotaxis protein